MSKVLKSRSKTASKGKRSVVNDIAIVGISGRFPDANNYDQYWGNLEKGINSIWEIPPERWDLKDYYSPNINNPNTSISKWCGLLSDIEAFDNTLFHISPREANSMDPQQRLLLEETWSCIEDSGVSLAELQHKTTSVFVGAMTNDYRQIAVQPGREIDNYDCLGNFEG